MKPIPSRKVKHAWNIFWLMVFGQLISLGGFMRDREHYQDHFLVDFLSILLIGLLDFLVLTALYLLLLGLIRLFSRTVRKRRT